VAQTSFEINKIPPHRDVALRVISLLDDPEASLTELSRLVANDVALATRVLRLANSSFFGRRSDITAIDRAIIAVGFSTVRTFAVSAAFDLFAEQRAPLPKDFWNHAMTSAAASTVLARHARVNTSDAFSAGLIHDVGVALLFRSDPARYQEHIITPDLGEVAALQVEKALFGSNHVEAAVEGLADVRFPNALIDAVATHHEPIKKRRFGRPSLGNIVAGAQLICDAREDQVAKMQAISTVVDSLGIDTHPQLVAADIADTLEEVRHFGS
jgi:putative nucleotidyltransferase with HDIG domain